MVTSPEQGLQVRVRNRSWVVAEVERAALASGTTLASQPHQHLVTLASLEDDAGGEELQVVWELEPGARVIGKAALPAPTAFDHPHRLDTFLDAIRWGAISSADTRRLQSPFRSGIDIEDYQLDPVARAIEMPRVSLLISDDVGLGKTIEAGLVALELLLRHRARSILVVCPSALQLQWRDQLRDKFGLEFRIVDAALMRELRRSRGIHTNPWSHYPRLITSIDYLKRERPLARFRETLPAAGESVYPRRYDLLIVDEAHNVAPAGRGRYATDSQRTAAIRTLTPHFEHKLFLTATPHNGYRESFSALLEMLDNQRFARGVEPDPEQLGAVMVRRLKSDLPPRWDGTPRFPPRELIPLEVAYGDTERHAHGLLARYTRLRRERARNDAERVAAEFVLKLLKKRLFSSPAAFHATLEQHLRTLQGRRAARHDGPRQPASILRQLAQAEEEEYADEEWDDATGDALAVAGRLFADLSAEERGLLDELSAWAGAARDLPDARSARLVGWLNAELRPDGRWNDHRVIIFTEYRATQHWLQDQLAAAGLAGGGRLLTIYGGMDNDQREHVKAAFQAEPGRDPVRILLATDAASEGIDLQNHCSRLLHWEIPWNPNRLEQRNGRIDRHGQRAERVLIHHFVSAGYDSRGGGGSDPGSLDGDLEFLRRAALKVEQIREDLGRVGPVIAQQVEQAMLGARRTLDTAAAEREAGGVKRMLRVERQLAQRIAQLREQIDDARRDLRLEPARVQAAVATALALAGQPPLRSADVPGLPSGSAWWVPALSGSWASCSAGLADPLSGEPRPIVFDEALAQGRADLVLAHLNHRLVAMALRLLRAEVWSAESRRRLARVSARVVPDGALDSPAVIAHGRLAVTGADGVMLHEELIAAGGLLREGRFARLNVGEVQRALDAATDEPAPEAFQQRIAALWPQHEASLGAALEARAGDRRAGMERQLREREAKEAGNIRAVLDELRAAIERELDVPTVQQLALFSLDEREQLARDTDALRRRLAQLPGELEQELRRITDRYATQQQHLFPVAVEYLVPRRLARELAGGPGRSDG